jgi:hypothetical protein
MMGRTGKAPPPPVGSPGSFGGGGVSLDSALVAVVGVGAPLCDTPPATAPHPTIKTNKPAPARNAIAVLPVFITTTTVGSQHDIRISETSPHGPALQMRDWCWSVRYEHGWTSSPGPYCGSTRPGGSLDGPIDVISDPVPELRLASGILELGEQGDPVISYRGHDSFSLWS